MNNDKTSIKEIGNRIKRLRESKGESQEELAETLNIANRETIARWENGTREIKREHIILLAKHYNVTSDYLLGISPYKCEQEMSELQQEIKPIIENYNDMHEVIKALNNLTTYYNYQNMKSPDFYKKLSEMIYASVYAVYGKMYVNNEIDNIKDDIDGLRKLEESVKNSLFYFTGYCEKIKEALSFVEYALKIEIDKKKKIDYLISDIVKTISIGNAQEQSPEELTETLSQQILKQIYKEREQNAHNHKEG